jgi:hypothetical protein
MANRTHKKIEKNKKYEYDVLDVLFSGLKGFPVAWIPFMEA